MVRAPTMRGLALALTGAAILAAAPGATAAQAGGDRQTVAAVWPLPVSGARPAAPTSAPDPRCPVSEVPRARTDRDDVLRGRQVHVVYLVPRGAPDQELDSSGVLDCSIRALAGWFRRQTGLAWRFDTTAVRVASRRTRSVIDVTYVPAPVPRSRMTNIGAVSTYLKEAGFDDPRKRYLTFVSGGAPKGPCGEAFYPLVTTSGSPPDGRHAAVYLFSDPACRAGSFGRPGRPSWAEAIALQELIHNDGMTPVGAPHSCAWLLPFAHVCTPGLGVASPADDPEAVDVMFPFVTLPLARKVVDRGEDDYLGHGLPLRDLSDSPYLEPAR